MKDIKKKMKRLFYLRVAVLMPFFLGLCLTFPPLPVQAAVQSVRLFGVTGDGANTPETLFELSQEDASSTPVISLFDRNGLGKNNDGEAIAFNPVDGLLYHWSGLGERQNVDEIFESIDPKTLEISPIILSGDNYDEAVAATYNSSTGEFFVADVFMSLYTVTTGGIVDFIGSLDHPSKGLAFVGTTLYSVSRDDNYLRTIDPLTAATLTSVPITITGFNSVSANGLVTHPYTGDLWGLLKDSGSRKVRHLVIIDPSTGDATDIGSTGDAFASIAFVHPLEFSTFTLKKAMVEFKNKPDNDEFMVKGKFVLGEGHNGIDPFIDPFTECVAVNVGTLSIAILPDSPDSFEWGGPGIFKFIGTVNGAHVKMKIVETGTNTFVFIAKGKGVDLTDTNNPLFVELIIGDDAGQSNIRLKGELNSWWKGKKRNRHHGDDDRKKKKKKRRNHRSDDDSSSDDD